MSGLHLSELLESSAAHYRFAQNKQLIASLTLLTTVCARTECNALRVRVTDKRLHVKEIDYGHTNMHTLHTLLTLNT